MKPASSPRPAPLSIAARLDSALLFLVCFAMCGQMDVRHFGRDTLAEGLGYASKTFALSLSDVVFALLIVWFVARTVQLKAWKRLWWPPLPCWALLFALGLSVVHSPKLLDVVRSEHHLFTKETKVALADLAQWFGYFALAPWIFVNLVRDRRDGSNTLIRRENVVIGGLVAGFVASGLLALFQTVKYPGIAPHGLWGSHNLFAAFVAFLLPFLDEIEIPGRRFERVPLALSLFAFGVLVLCVASPFAAGAGLLGLLCSWAARPNPKRLRIMRLAMILFAALFVGITWSRVPQLQSDRAEQTRLASATQSVKKRWIEWEVASRWNSPIERAFATGFGPGNYQLNIGTLYQYDGVPNEEKMPPDSNNLYLVQAMSIGVLGLGALLWVVSHFGAIAWRAARGGSWLGAAVFGALGAWLFVNPFHALIVRGAGLLLGMFFALAIAAANNTAAASASKEGDSFETVSTKP